MRSHNACLFLSKWTITISRLKAFWKTENCRAEDIFKISLSDLQVVLLKMNVCWETFVILKYTKMPCLRSYKEPAKHIADIFCKSSQLVLAT